MIPGKGDKMENWKKKIKILTYLLCIHLTGYWEAGFSKTGLLIWASIFCGFQILFLLFLFALKNYNFFLFDFEAFNGTKANQDNNKNADAPDNGQEGQHAFYDLCVPVFPLQAWSAYEATCEERPNLN